LRPTSHRQLIPTAADIALAAGDKVLPDLPRGFFALCCNQSCACLYVWPQVFLADPFQSFTSQGDWGTRLMSTDGLHLSKAGNDEVWNIFYNAINDKMQLT
jgi:hypothetical protein